MTTSHTFPDLRLMTASSHHAQQTYFEVYGMNVLYTAVSYAMHDKPYRLFS